MTNRPALPEPVVVAQFWKNRRGEAVVVQLREYNGRVLFDARQHYTDRDGILCPTTKGLSLAVLRLPELAAAVTKALAKARELGLIEADGAGS
jgi:hypothetical protein